MALTKLDIANMALEFLGQGRISSLAENSNAARTMNFWWEKSVNEALSRSAWSFARKQKALSLITNDRSDAWAYRYDMPSDSLSFKGLMDPTGAQGPVITTAYLIDSGSIYANIDGAYARYIWANYDPASWIVQFSRAAAYFLARDSAVGITKKFTLADKLEQKAEAWLAKAIESDAAQEAVSWDDGNAYVRARGGRANNPWDASIANSPDGSQFWEH